VQMYSLESLDKQVNDGRKWCCFTNAGPGCNSQTSSEEKKSPEEVTFLYPAFGAFVVFFCEHGTLETKRRQNRKIGLEVELSREMGGGR
jgi:hypothetical protein